MVKRHLQVRLVKDSEEETQFVSEQSFKFPHEEVNELITRIFIGIGVLIVINTLGQIAIKKIS